MSKSAQQLIASLGDKYLCYPGKNKAPYTKAESFDITRTFKKAQETLGEVTVTKLEPLKYGLDRLEN
jgi:hypothetical protein